MERYENREDFLLRFASALWKLTYDLTKTEKDILAIINNYFLF